MKRITGLLVFVFIILICWSGVSFADDSATVKAGKWVSITSIGDVDWICTSTAGTNGLGLTSLHVRSIQFNPVAIGDKLVVRNGSVTGPIVAYFYATVAGQPMYRPINPDAPLVLHMDSSEWTVTAGCTVLIELD